MRAIPLAVGVIGLSFAASGCSDAKKVANAMEKLCKANCECPEFEEDWNEVRNCKKACAGYAELYEAQLADLDEEPCDDIGNIAKDIAACAKKSCGESRDECADAAYSDLFECWGYDYYGYDDGAGGKIPNDAAQLRTELRRGLLYGPFATGEDR